MIFENYEFKQDFENKKKNIGFVIFKNREDAEMVCEIKTVKYRDAIIRVKWASSREEMNKSHYGNNQKDPAIETHNIRQEKLKRTRRELMKRRKEEYQKYLEYSRTKPTSRKYFQIGILFRNTPNYSNYSIDNLRMNKGRIRTNFSQLIYSSPQHTQESQIWGDRH